MDLPFFLSPKTYKNEIKRNREINKLIAQDKAKDKEIILLMLGAGESGKSTVIKQLRIINSKSFTKEEREQYIPTIIDNLKESVISILTAAKKFGNKLSRANREFAELLLKSSVEISPDTTKSFVQLFNDPNFEKTLVRGSEYQLLDSASYFFEHVQRITGKDYLPTDQDILRSRQKTTGIIETVFSVDGVPMRVIDVGGQRNQRRKWIHCFENVTAVIFCAALNGYALQLREDERVNRMKEALMLFEQICNSNWFKNTNIILFLNKVDLFKKKFVDQNVPLSVCFSDIEEPPQTMEDAIQIIKTRFLDQNKDPHKVIFQHITCATNTENIEFVFKALKGILLHSAMSSYSIPL
eukprot:TRINITY_DN10427_c0_g1_i1.p1 TRINITY_DN10427_c0_g1~~TRINITY_DN10427_c0_g1_i1.p1  ORF type:complete len:354 (-),score=55.58 TRINITY_DN10427_c0_g1_i1:15-1076(-)